MDSDSFSRIDLQTKAEFLFNYGDYITSIEYYGRKVDLFVFGGYYLEAFYNFDTGDLEDIQLLNPENRRLQIYSVGVDIKDLFKY